MRKNQLAWVFGELILLSWLTIPFIGRQHIESYLSSTMFISFFIMIRDMLLKKRSGGYALTITIDIYQVKLLYH
jgi:hypothetical protein